MHSPSIPGRGLAIVAGTALYIGSLSALFGDDLLDWSKWTMHHYEVIVTSLSTIAFGLLFRYAKRARVYLAAIGFAVLFVAGTSFVVYKSIGRQAAATTTQSMSADDANKLIADKMADLATTRQRLLDADAAADHERKGRPDRSGKPTTKPGCGDRCKDWTRRADEVRSRVKELEQEIRNLGPRQVAAPEAQTFAQILNIIFGWSVAQVKALAILFVPIAWTMFLEIGSICCFEYAFATGKRPKDAMQTSFAADNVAKAKQLLASDGPKIDPPKGGKRRSERLPATMPRRLPANVVPIGKGHTSFAVKHPVLAALEVAGKPLTNTELAEAMKVCGGESTKRRREVADLLDETVAGKFVLIGLKAWRQATA